MWLTQEIAGIQSSASRKVYADMINNGNLRKVVAFGGGVVQRTISQFIIFLAKSDKVRVFDTEEEALVWLKK